MPCTDRGLHRRRAPRQAAGTGLRATPALLALVSMVAGCSATGPGDDGMLRHAWSWSEGGRAAELRCIASPTQACHFRMARNGHEAGTVSVPVGDVVRFRFGASLATYCAAADADPASPCEPRFITAGFHFRSAPSPVALQTTP
jgi:hypothetical protein